MPSFTAAHATVPASDYERAKGWYADKLGLKPTEERPDGTYYDVGASRLFLYPSEFAGTNQATAATFEVDDIQSAVSELKENGVTFEHFDYPGIEWEGDVAKSEAYKGAWFKDSEGNIIALGERIS